MKTLHEFAVAALTGLLANEHQLQSTLATYEDDSKKAAKSFARTSYQIAKAMSAEQAKQHPGMESEYDPVLREALESIAKHACSDKDDPSDSAFREFALRVAQDALRDIIGEEVAAQERGSK